MPKIKIDHIISFSSEDPHHVANNILLSDPAKKWKCQTPGEKTAIIILQLEKASLISSIDIGNENSAYIEVLVSRSGSNDDYKLLLVMSSFMSPLEARQGTNINKVRMFGKDQLSDPECNENWDRVKIVCTQPFNRHVQYGLSFINLYSSEEKNTGAPTQTTIGKFVLRPESPDSFSVGSLFAKRKDEEEPLSGAAAIRKASQATTSSQLETKNFKPKAKNFNSSTKTGSTDSDDKDDKVLTRNRNELLYAKDEEEPHEKIDKIIEKKRQETKKKQESEESKTPKKQERKKEAKKVGESSKRRNESGDRAKSRKKIKVPDKPRKSFNQLLGDVTVVISGIQNPDRGNLRSKALEMGAKYKGDWDKSCTHLICAFANTPKFHQVRGKGKIVKRTWIEDCHMQRKRLPWRRYALDNYDKNQDESEEEILEAVKDIKSPIDISLSDDSTDDEGFDDKMQAKIKKMQSRKKDNEKKDLDPYSVETDEETEGKLNKEISKKLEDFLENKVFYIDDDLKEADRKLIKRYVVAYKGAISDTPDDVDIIITNDENADKLKEANPEPLFLTPDWVWKCHNSQSFVPPDQFTIF